MSTSSRHGYSSIRTPRCAIILLAAICIAAGCGRTDDAPAGKDADPAGTGDRAAEGRGTGYMDMKGWDLARAELKTDEEVVKALNEFFDIWGWAFEHRTFLRFKEALETADYLPGKLDGIKKLVRGIRRVPGYPEIDGLKGCYEKMTPLLRTAAGHFRSSIEAARDGDRAAERKHESIYVPAYKEAMAHLRKSYSIKQEIYTRGGRTEYQKLAGVKGHDTSTVPAFRAIVRVVIEGYEGRTMKQFSAMTSFAADKKWDLASLKADEAETGLQHSIMKAGKAEPGNMKNLWDARQELVGMLSYRLMGIQKFREYMAATRDGNAADAEKADKVYRILVKSAEESRAKLRRMGY